MTTNDLALMVECRTCPVRELHCGDCMVPVLLDLTAHAPPSDHALDAEERAAVTRLVGAGLVDADFASRVRARLDSGHGGRSAGTATPLEGRGGGRSVG